MTTQLEHYRELLGEAASALNAACKLLDRRFGSRRWREEWTIADTANKLRLEVAGYGSFEAAEEEADRRNSDSDGSNHWSARADISGAWVVMLDD